MTIHKEALTLALKDLKWVDNWLCEKPMSECVTKLRKAITAIKEALMSFQDGAQPEQEPNLAEAYRTELDKLSQRNYELRMENAKLKQPKEPEQEPVARSDAYDMIDRFLQNNLNSDADYAEYSKALDSIYTTPPQRKPLTDDEIMVVLGDFPFYASEWFEDDYYRFARAIEAAHGIRPTDFKE